MARKFQAASASALLSLLWLSAVPASAVDNVFPGAWRTSTLGQLAPLLEGREGACSDFSSALVGGIEQDRIYMTHGYRGVDTLDVRAYDIDTNTWIALAPTVGPGVPAKSEGAGVTVGGLVYCVGGRIGNATTNVTVYDPTSNSLGNVASLGTARAGVAVENWGRFIYAIGGRTAGGGPCSGPALNSAERYDVTTNTWAPITAPPVAVSDAAAVSHGGKIYVIGGCDGALVVPSPVQILDPNTGTWSVGPSMPTPRASLAAEALGNTIYATGGLTGFGGANLATVEGLDIDKGVWSGPLTPKPTPSSEVQAVRHGNSLYLPGTGAFGAAGSIFEAFQRK